MGNLSNLPGSLSSFLLAWKQGISKVGWEGDGREFLEGEVMDVPMADTC